MNEVCEYAGRVLFCFASGLFAVLFLAWMGFCFREAIGRGALQVAGFVRNGSVAGRILGAALAAGFIVYGSTKSERKEIGTRGGMQRVGLRTEFNAVTGDEIAAGYHLAASSRVPGIVAMPCNAVTNSELRMHGGCEYPFWIEPEGWRFVCAKGEIGGVAVVSNGRIGSDFCSAPFPLPPQFPVSVLPEARWGMLAEPGDCSIFSHWTTERGSLILNWRNALAGREVDKPVNLQCELFGDGVLEWRSDEVRLRYHPALPFDWDFDGLENSVDPEPQIANDVAAFGTNSEWRRIVCSGIFREGEGGTDWREVVPTNAYYFVEVAVEEGPAPVYFAADRDSRLGSPAIVALSGQTNRVPLTIGLEYSVTSTVPFTVSTPADGYAEVAFTSECSCIVRWPIEFEFEQTGYGTYGVSVKPYDPGGEFIWGGGMRTLGIGELCGSCGCWRAEGRNIYFNCRAHCWCGGNCKARGTYSGEASFEVVCGMCRCNWCVCTDHGSEHPDPREEGVAYASFSKEAIIFEDAYANSSGDSVGKRSTTARLYVSAYGGENGGTARIDCRNLGKLSPENGTGPISLPSTVTLGKWEAYSAVFDCSGNEASGSVDDVEVAVTFTDAETGEVTTSRDSLTVVKVELVPQVLFPYEFPNRHIFGVCESVDLYYFPDDITGVEITSSSNAIEFRGTGNQTTYQFLPNAGENTFTVTYNNETFGTQTRCIAPSSIQCHASPDVKSYGLSPGEAGGAGMNMVLTVHPSNVSFKDLRIKEKATENGHVSGYFSQPMFAAWWNHTAANGAEQPVRIGDRNEINDTAELSATCPPVSGTNIWSSGEILWTIPVVWREPWEFPVSNGYRELSEERQRFTIDAAGTVGVEKFGRRVERTVHGETTCTETQ